MITSLKENTKSLLIKFAVFITKGVNNNEGGQESLAQCALLFWATYFIRAKHKARDQRPKPSSEDTHVNKVPGASFKL